MAVALVAAPLPPALREKPIQIELRRSVEVERPQVTLGEIAILNSEDAQALRSLKSLPLGRAPRAGGSVVVGQDGLERWIAARTDIDLDRIHWSGPRASSIRLASRIVEGDKVARCAKTSLAAAFARTGLRAEISLVRTPQDLRVPTGAVELKARPEAALQPAALEGENGLRSSSNPLFSKKQSVWVDVWVGGNFIRTVPVGFDVSVFAPAYVATEDMPAGGALEPAKLKVREVEWSGRNPLPVAAHPTAGGEAKPVEPALKLRRPLMAGDAVTQAHVEPAPLVARGGYATLREVEGPIEVESRVEVLQDGFMGQTISVKLPNASSSVQARVVGPGMVEVRQ
ncbi:MAG TPA: flagellar basal body P-ring formation chaperone FlgA [Geothrix sp.]|nr:flagellar basal body P-ring formation chaperone FlgA [Geothrix sp.]